ncbi:FACT complex subunit SPT16, partial [Cucurbita argyrosperma subsp. sororia]
MWSSSDVLAIGTPPPASEDLRYLKSSALPETIIVFTKKQIHLLCSQKKASLLDVVKKSASDAVGAVVVMHVKAKNDDGSSLMDAIFRAIRAQSKADGMEKPVVGYFELGDITNGLPDLFACKDDHEIMNICYPPIFQSGGEFDLRPSAARDDELLHYDLASVITDNMCSGVPIQELLL